MKSFAKRTLAVFLTVLLLFSTMAVGFNTVSAATSTTVYFVNSWKWGEVRCYGYNDVETDGTFPGFVMSEAETVDGYKVYSYDVSDYATISFNDGTVYNKTDNLDASALYGKYYEPKTNTVYDTAKEALISAGFVTAQNYVAGSTLYLQPGCWKSDNARFAAYFYNTSGSSAWADLTQVANDASCYQVKVPSGSWTFVIFCRMDGATTDNTWDNRWNQSANLLYDGSSNCYSISDWGADKAVGSWKKYSEKVVYFVNTKNWANVKGYGWTNGIGSDTAWPGKDATLVDSNNKVYSYNPGDRVEVLFNDGNSGRTNYFTCADVYGKYIEPKTNAVYNTAAEAWAAANAYVEPTEAPTTATEATEAPSVSSFTLSRVYFDNSASKWDKVYVYGWSNGLGGVREMVKIAGTDYWYMDLPQALPVGTAAFLFKDDIDVWNNYTGDAVVTEPYNLYKPTTTGSACTMSKYTGTVPTATTPTETVTAPVTASSSSQGSFSGKTYYLAPGEWVTDGARFAAYFTISGNSGKWVDMKDSNSDGLYEVVVPAGEYNQVVFYRMDGSKTANTEANAWNKSNITYLEYGNCYTITLPWSEYDPGDWSTITVDSNAPGYCLFGSFNGVNVGWEDDIDNVSHKFVNGKLTMTFTSDSYVAVKTTDNANWYMFDEYTTTTGGTLYNTSTGVYEKMFVPAGTVTFYIGKSGSDILYLTYTTATVEPTTAKNDGVFLVGDFNSWSEKSLPMTKSGTVCTTTITVAAGSYKFKIIEDGTFYGNDGIIEDTTAATTNAGWIMRTIAGDCILAAVGGTYTFAYDTETNALVVTYDVNYTTNSTLRLAVPNGTYDAYNWTAPALTYCTTVSSTVSDFTQIPMTKTDEVFYAGTTGSCTLIKPGAWSIYEVTLTPEQQEILISSPRVGFAGSASALSRTTITSNILKAGINVYSTYGTKTAMNKLNNHTFIITDSAYGEKSSSSYVGYWVSDFTTVRATAVLSGNAYSNWDAMSLYYGSSKTIDENVSIPMVDTGLRTKVEDIGTIQTAITGRWSVYAISLDPIQEAALNASVYSGFRKTNAENRTLITTNVLKAPLDYYTGSYDTTKKKIASLEDRIFVICDNTYTGKSVISYVGAWESEEIYTQGQDDKITLYFAAPIARTAYAYYDWGTEVDLYYSNYGSYLTSNRIPMTFTGNYYVAEDVAGATRIMGGKWPIVKAELTVEQMAEIQNSYYVGFIKSGGKFRTKYTSGRNVLRAPKTEFTGTYGNKTSVDSLDGYLFLIQGVAVDGFESDCYIGSWVKNGNYDGDLPERSECYLVGDFNSWNEASLPLTQTSVTETTYTITQTIAKGSYEFKILDDGAWYSNDGIIEDTTVTSDSTSWQMDVNSDNCVLKATGGTYQFVYDAATKTLRVNYVAALPSTAPSTAPPSTFAPTNVYLVGDFNDWSTTATNLAQASTTYMKTIYLDPGTYQFKIYADDIWFGCDATIVDTTETETTSGYKMSTTAGNCTFKATGGTYKFKFGSVTQTIFITQVSSEVTTPTTPSTSTTPTTPTTPSTPEPTATTVYLAGDFNGWSQTDTPLAKSGETYTTTVNLSAGTYKFKVIDDGAWYGNNGTIVDTTTTTSNVGWVMDGYAGDCTLEATGGTYTFTYNTTTKALIIVKA